MTPPLIDKVVRTLFEESADAVLLVDPAGGIVLDTNPAAERLTGCSRQLLRGQRAESLLTAFGAPSLADLFGIKTSLPEQAGYLLQTDSRGTLPVALTITRLNSEPEVLLWLTLRPEIAAVAPLTGDVSDDLPRAVLESMQGAAKALDSEGRLVYVNAAFCKFVGWSRKELIGQKAPFSFWAPEEIDSITVRFRETLRGNLPQRGYQLRYQRRDGRLFDALVEPAPLAGVGGRSIGWVTTVTDITDLKRAESALRASEQRFRSLCDCSPEGIFMTSPEGIVTWSNARLEAITSLSAAEIQGRAWADQFGELSAARLGVEWSARARGGRAHAATVRFVRKDGAVRWLEVETAPVVAEDARLLGHVGVVLDVTDRRRADEVLRESERRYRLLADHSTDMISRHDADGRYVYVSPASSRLLGYSPGEMLGRSLSELLAPDHRTRVMEAFNHLTKHGGGPETLAFLMSRKDGSAVWVEATWHALRMPGSGMPLEVHLASRDVTERREAENRLRASQERFRALVEKSSDGVVVADKDWIVRYASPAAGRILGRSPEDLDGFRGESIVHPDDIAALNAQSGCGRETDGSMRFRFRALRSDGSWRHLDAVITDFRADPNIGGYVINFRDVTDRHELEEQLKQAQKMEAVGQLAGGIAHDFNNLLTAIIGNVVEVLKTTHLSDPAHELLAAADTAARRAAELTAQLLSFSRRQPLRLKPLHLERTVEEARLILRPAIDPRVRIKSHIEPGLWTVLADAAQMTSVLVNLGLNARDAMPDGGELRIGLANVVVDDAYVAAHVYAKRGEHVRLSVEDSGHGIPLDIVRRVFEPFFTTKPLGSGTGLGLAMVYGTVKAHDGWITCESDVGTGTRFEIYLPRTQQTEPVRGESSPHIEPEHAPAEQRQTILLVDDEPAIRTLSKRVLEMQGFRVLLAEDGLDALESYYEMRNEIGLVVLDLTMPRLSGHDTLKRLREIDPAVRVLLSSGYSVDQTQIAISGVGFVSKPYRPDELVRAVRQALGKIGDGHDPGSR